MTSLLLITLLGLAIGVALGLTGVGAGSVLTPALVLLGVGLATAVAAGVVAWAETQQVRSQQEQESGLGAGRLAPSVLRLQTATASQQFACDVAALSTTAKAYAAGTSSLQAIAQAGVANAAPGQVLVFASPAGVVLARGLAEESGRAVRLDTLAICGSTSRELSGQIDAALVDPPHAVLIMIGANDVTRRMPPRQSAKLLGDGVARLRSTGVAVVVGTCPDLGSVRAIPQPLRASVRLDVCAMSRNGCGIGRIVPRSGQVAAITVVPVARSLDTAMPSSLADSHGGTRRVTSFAPIMISAACGGSVSAPSTWLPSRRLVQPQIARVSSRTARPLSLASPRASTTPGSCSGRSTPRPAAEESPSIVNRSTADWTPTPAEADGRCGPVPSGRYTPSARKGNQPGIMMLR